MRNLIRSTALCAALMAVALSVSGGNVTVPNTFVAGTPAKAADVNYDFAAVATVVNSNATAITEGNGRTNPGAAPDESAFIRTTSRSFAVRVSAAQLGAQIPYNVSFASTDCTGQAYLTATPYSVGFLAALPMLPFAAVVHTAAYIGGTTVDLYTYAYSYLSFTGTSTVCLSWGTNGISGDLVPVIGTFDLSTLNLTPPFSVQ